MQFRIARQRAAMSHVSEETLAALLAQKLTASDLNRLSTHLHTCRPCERRIEEWRDHFPEVDAMLPERTHAQVRDTESVSHPVIMPPSFEPRPRTGSRPHPAHLLWVVAAGLALFAVLYATRDKRQERSAVDSTLSDEPVVVARVDTAAGVTPPTKPRDSTRTRSGATGTRPAGATPPAAAAPRGTPPPKPAAVPATPRTKPAGADTTALQGETTMPQFSRISLPDASKRLGGDIRLLEGLRLQHAEVGPGKAVPGAQSDLQVIRLVYRAPDGTRVLLDQQHIPVDASGFRSINDAALENGDTLSGSAPNGVSVATWVDGDGYRISLAGQMSEDSLKRLVRQVH